MDTLAERPDGEVSLQQQVDAISLEQALLDFEVANARVMDLTRRLVEATTTMSEQSTELQQLKIEYARLKTENDQMRSSRAFRTAERIWAIRNAVGI